MKYHYLTSYNIAEMCFAIFCYLATWLSVAWGSAKYAQDGSLLGITPFLILSQILLVYILIIAKLFRTRIEVFEDRIRVFQGSSSFTMLRSEDISVEPSFRFPHAGSVLVSESGSFFFSYRLNDYKGFIGEFQR